MRKVVLDLVTHLVYCFSVGGRMLLPSGGQFADSLFAEACSIVQVDVARAGGITGWQKVARMVEAMYVAVFPYFLMLHTSLFCAIPYSWMRSRTRASISAQGWPIGPRSHGLGSRGTNRRSKHQPSRAVIPIQVGE